MCNNSIVQACMLNGCDVPLAQTGVAFTLYFVLSWAVAMGIGTEKVGG